MSADLPSPSFNNIGVHGCVVQQTMEYNLPVTNKISRGCVATAKFERLDIQFRVVA